MVLIARDIVERDFNLLVSSTNAFEASKIMKQNHHGFVVVSSPDGKPIGMVTEWDFISKIVSEGRDPASVRLEEIMSTNLVTVKASEGIGSVAKIMADRGIRRVLVTEADGKIIGVITSKTILRRLEEYIDKISADIARLHSPIA